MNNIICNSGGAKGSDSIFEEHCMKHGIKVNAFSYKTKYHTSENKVEISDDDFNEGIEMIKKANEILKRSGIFKFINLLARNWCQVKYSDATFAIANGLDLKTGIVDGGTGWAVAMSIMANHPTFVYVQMSRQWYMYSFEMKKFVECDTPTLTNNFAGIGTREINGAGLDAIANCYMKITPITHFT